ncbi:hypothetical protein WBG99_16935 [Streptomyces sp. TG1A-60]|uniref:hypothetical protein n=1 Tax=Streptomyces sp. TG1A-60 TaxID=3129111 RepID=UPI0030CC1256
MRRPYRVLTRVVGVGLLAGAAAACAVDKPGHPRGFPEAAVVETAPATPTAPTEPALTDARARSALLRQGDLGGAWSGTEGAATWRDGLLKGRTDLPECQELLDAVYAEDLLGEPRGGTAVTGFDDEYGAQLHYRVGAYDMADVDARLDRVRRLIGKCREFTITGPRGREYGAEVTPVDLPGTIGDARQGLRLAVGGDGAALTLDLAAVRVGDTAVLLTHGGLHGIDEAATRDAAQAGTRRLQSLLKEEPKEREGERELRVPSGEETAEGPSADEGEASEEEDSSDEGDSSGDGEVDGDSSAARWQPASTSASPPTTV